MALFTASKGFKTLDWQSNVNTRTTETVSGKTFRVKTGNQKWSFRLSSPAMSKADFLADYTFFIQRDGTYESFTIVPPEIGSTRGTASGTITVSGVTVAETESGGVALGLTAGSSNVGVNNAASGTLKKGDLIKFSNHDKVYMLTADVNLDGSSVNALSFYPPLTTAVTSSHTVTYNSVPVKVFLDTDELKFVTQPDGLYRYEITLNEEI
tara:strand:+ start:181 stop:810 length:630 start_codon:yes stop_codon:yes gene_type:complete